MAMAAARLLRARRVDQAWRTCFGQRAYGIPPSHRLDPLPFLDAALAVRLDGGAVNEDIASAVVRGDEAEALVGVEPLHCGPRCAFSCWDDLRDSVANPALVQPPAF